MLARRLTSTELLWLAYTICTEHDCVDLQLHQLLRLLILLNPLVNGSSITRRLAACNRQQLHLSVPLRGLCGTLASSDRTQQQAATLTLLDRQHYTASRTTPCMGRALNMHLVCEVPASIGC